MTKETKEVVLSTMDALVKKAVDLEVQRHFEDCVIADHETGAEIRGLATAWNMLNNLLPDDMLCTDFYDLVYDACHR